MKFKYVISYDPVSVYALNDRIRKSIAKKGYDKIFELRKRLEYIVTHSGLPYPPVTVIPEARLLVHEGDITAVVYANINYRYSGGYLHPIVEIYLPFLLYSPAELQTLVMAHEFLHYIYLAIRYVSSDYLMNPLIYTGDLTGRSFLEDLYTVNPEKIFDSPRFINKLNRIHELLEKNRIGYNIKKRWIDKDLPSKSVFADDFRIKMSMNMWTNMYFPEDVLRKARVLLSEKQRSL